MCIITMAMWANHQQHKALTRNLLFLKSSLRSHLYLINTTEDPFNTFPLYNVTQAI